MWACPGMWTRGCCSFGRTCWRAPASRRSRRTGPIGATRWPACAEYGMATPLLLPTNEFEPLLALALQQPGEVLRDGGRYGNFSSSDFRRALGFYAERFQLGEAPGLTNNQVANLWQEFGRGTFAFYISGPWNIGEFKRRLPPELAGAWTTAELPGADRPGCSVHRRRRQPGHVQALAPQARGLGPDQLPEPARRAAAVLPPDRRPAAAPQHLGHAAGRRRHAGRGPPCRGLPPPAGARAPDAGRARVGAHRQRDAARRRACRRRPRDGLDAPCAGWMRARGRHPGKAPLDAGQGRS